MRVTVSGARSLALALLLARSAHVRALLEDEDALSKLEVHRRRACEASLLWRADFAAVGTVDELLSPGGDAEGRAWSVADGCSDAKLAAEQLCWAKQNVAVSDGELELSVGPQGHGTRIQMRATADTSSQGQGGSILRLGVIAHFPQFQDGGDSGHEDTRATIAVQLPRRNLTASMSVAPSRQESDSEIWLTSSRNTSTFVALPCSKSVGESFREFEFVWSGDWLRWYVNGVMLFEESIADVPAANYKSKHRADTKPEEDTVSVEFAYTVRGQLDSDATMEPTTSKSPFRIKSLGLVAANPHDPFCRPRHRSEMNCREKTPWTPRLGSNQGYLSTDEVDAFIDEIGSTLPAYLTSVEELGTSIDGRRLRALCLGRCQDGSNVPQTLYTGMHHSREPISMMNLVYTIDILVADFVNGDLDMLHLLLSRQLWFILVVNPDGYARNEQQRMWTHHATGQRKNTRAGCANAFDTGVDLNRNYDVCFNHDNIGSNPDVCAEDYRGPHPFSEPETQAVRAIVEDRGRNFSAALNYHSFGRYFNIPFACESLGTASGANASLFDALASEMARYNQFQYGQPWKDSNLYTVNGETSDWMWNAHGIFAMSPEVGPDFSVSSDLGFWPPIDQVPALSTELHYSNLHLARVSGPMYTLDVTKIDVKPDKVDIHLTVSNVGLRSDHSGVEVIVARLLNGTGANQLLTIPAAKLGSALHVVDFSQSVSLPASPADADLRELYIVLRDALSCTIFRTSIGKPAADFTASSRQVQTWLPLHLPRCGTCEIYGATDGTSTTIGVNATSVCADVGDIATLESAHFRLQARDEFAIPATFPTTASGDYDSSSRSLPSPANASSGIYSTVQDAEASDSSSIATSAFLPIAGATLFIVAALLTRLVLKRGINCCARKTQSTVDGKPSRQKGNAAYARVVVNDESDEEDGTSDNNVDADTTTEIPSNLAGIPKPDGQGPRTSDRGRKVERGIPSRRVRSPSPSQRSSSSTKHTDQIV